MRRMKKSRSPALTGERLFANPLNFTERAYTLALTEESERIIRSAVRAIITGGVW